MIALLNIAATLVLALIAWLAFVLPWQISLIAVAFICWALLLYRRDLHRYSTLEGRQ